MRAQVLINKDVDKQRGLPALKAFAAGLKRLGIEHRVVDLDDARPDPDGVLVCWSVFKEKFPQRLPFYELQKAQKACGGDLLIIERGFVRRDEYYVVVWDDLNGRGRFPHSRTNSPSDRWAELGVDLHPWKRGDEILVVGQVPWDTSCQHVNFQKWAQGTCDELKHHFTPVGKTVFFRPHPLRPSSVRVRGVPICTRPLDEALGQAFLVVTFSSTTGVDAVVAGVPAVAADHTSMIHGLCGHSPYDAEEVERLPWAYWLAYCQWTFEEMREGLPWNHFYG